MFVDEFNKKYSYRPEWGANNAYMQFAIWARMVSEAGTFYPPDVIKTVREGRDFPVDWSATCTSAPRITSWFARSSSSAARRRRT